MGWFFRWRLRRAPWFSSLTGPFTKTCAHCDIEKPLCDFAPPPTTTCPGCRRQLCDEAQHIARTKAHGFLVDEPKCEKFSYATDPPDDVCNDCLLGCHGCGSYRRRADFVTPDHTPYCRQCTAPDHPYYGPAGSPHSADPRYNRRFSTCTCCRQLYKTLPAAREEGSAWARIVADPQAGPTGQQARQLKALRIRKSRLCIHCYERFLTWERAAELVRRDALFARPFAPAVIARQYSNPDAFSLAREEHGEQCALCGDAGYELNRARSLYRVATDPAELYCLPCLQQKRHYRHCAACNLNLQPEAFHYDTNADRREYCRPCAEARQLVREPPDPSALSQLVALGLLDGRTPNLPPKEHGELLTLDPATRTRHLYVVGRTGSGKSVFLTYLARQDLLNGRGLAFLDPHGDAAEELAGCVPDDRLEQVTYLDPTDPGCPAFNLLAMPFDPAKLTTDIVSAFRMFFGESSFGPRMEHLMRSALLTLLFDRHHEPHSIADLRRILVDDAYQATIVARLAGDDVGPLRSFWHDEYPGMSKDAAAPILNKIATVLVPGSPLLRLFSNASNAVDIPGIMDRGEILLVNLSKGQLGEQPAKLLGGLITTAIAQSALARHAIPQDQRRPFHFTCDEFQNFAAIESTESILSEARKYALCLTLAHQTLGQLPSKMRDNITGNVATMVAFAISADDARTLRSSFATEYERPKKLSAADEWRIQEYRSASDKPPPAALDAVERYHWPDVPDFVSLPVGAAFVRIHQPSATRCVTIPYPLQPVPDPAKLPTIRVRQQKRRAESAQEPRIEAGAYQDLPPEQSEPTEPDDFTF